MRLRGLLAAAAALSVAAGCGRDAGQDDRAAVRPGWRPGGAPPAELARGAAVFEQRCVQCHGEYALGTDQGPPLLHLYYEPNHHADAAFHRAIAFGVQPHHWDFGPMPPVDGVGREGAAAVTAYVRWLQREAGIY